MNTLKINSVTGPISAEDVGMMLMRENIYLSYSGLGSKFAPRGHIGRTYLGNVHIQGRLLFFIYL